jgi:hypothetical protein
MRSFLSAAILLVAILPGNAAERPRDFLQEGRTAYQHGDYILAMERLTVAAQQGSMAAQTLIGHIFRDGHGGNGGSGAETHYLVAAEHGDCAAQLSLARMYQLGGYVVPDSEKAVRWYRIAANNGSAWAQFALASFFNQGMLVPKNEVRAYFWFSVLAARQSNIEDRVAMALKEVAIRSLVAIRGRMTTEQLAGAIDLLDKQPVDPMGCDSGQRSH